MSTTTTTTTSVPPQTKKNHVKELKRLFESKKSSSPTVISITTTSSGVTTSTTTSSGTSNPISALSNKLKLLKAKKNNSKSPTVISPTISSSSSSSSSSLSTPVSNNTKASTTPVDENLDKPVSSIVRSKSTSNHQLILNFDNIVSQADKKYYFYVNEALRKNIPIVPSLAIRRKSLDLTHSPIKGSLYAQNYQHSYSPSTRTIQLSKTPKLAIDNNNNNINNRPQQTRAPLLSHRSLSRNDSSWIKQQSEESAAKLIINDNQNNNNNQSTLTPTPTPIPTSGKGITKKSNSSLKISRSTFELKKPNLFLSKEEPTKLTNSSDDSLAYNNNNNNSGGGSGGSSPYKQPIHHTLSVSKLKLAFSKEEQQQQQQQQDQSASSPPQVSQITKDLESIGGKKEDKKSKLLSWVSLRRVKRSNTVDIHPPNLTKSSDDSSISKSPKQHTKYPTTTGKPPLLLPKSQQSPSPPSSSMSAISTSLPSKIDIPSIFIESNDNSPSSSPSSTSSSTSLLQSTLKKSLSSPSSPNHSPLSSPSITTNMNSFLYQQQQQQQQTLPTIQQSPILQSQSSSQYNTIEPIMMTGANSNNLIKNKRVISVAKIISKSSTLPISPALSAPSSPVISPLKEAMNLKISNPVISTSSNSNTVNSMMLPEVNKKLLKPTSSTAELLTSPVKLLIGDSDEIKLVTAEKLPAVSSLLLETAINATRTRSVSVGSMFESLGKFEIKEIPPLKVHLGSLEECLEVFQKPTPPHGRVFVLDLGNCSLGDDGITQISQEIPGGLEIADLSWNDLTTDGLNSFYEMLSRTKSLITSLSLQGNSLNPDSIQTLLDAIEMDQITKKDYKGFGLNLKETSIENEGAEYLARYLEHNKLPNIIGLNLTCASVTDMAMSAFSVALKKSVSLTTLILDENYLGDDGAVLLADGLKYNTTLTHLQLRNTDIGERGTIEICNSFKFNSSILVLDLSLNPWQLPGEIALQSLTIHKQQQSLLNRKKAIIYQVPKIQWKDDGLESNLDTDEVEEIVNHFGTDKIIDVLMLGIQFTPLVEKEKLYECIRIETKHLSKIFQHIVSPIGIADGDHINSLKLLIQLLPTHLENHEFISTFITNLPSLISLLDRGTIDFLILELIDFFALLVKSNNQSCFQVFSDAHLFSKVLQLLFQHPKNNILHQGIINLIQSTLDSSNDYLTSSKEDILKLESLENLTRHLLEESKLLPGKRSSNFGHLLELASIINNSVSDHPYLTTSNWMALKSVLKKEKELQDSYLCGFIPDRNQKLSPDLLSKFEKEFKR